MTDEDWDEMWSRIDETAYYSFSIELDIVHEHRGYGLVGKVGVFHKTIDNHGYFY